MKVEVLVAAMNQNDHSLVEKMNIQTSAIIGNQCSRNEIEEFSYKGNTVKVLSFNERGVGRNRNNALMRATGDLCLLADDDMVYVDGYEKIVKDAFESFKDADVIIFNIHEEVPQRFIIKEPFKVNFFNFMRFGAARIAFKRESIEENGIFFNLSFGGGAKYNSGEDTLFLNDCLKKGLNIVAVPMYIATLTEERESTWFKGYDDKYFYDKGVVFGQMSRRLSKPLCLQYVLRNKNEYKGNRKWTEVYKLMISGVHRK